MSPSSRVVGWPALVIRDRTVPGGYWMFTVQMTNPNRGPRELSIVNANGQSWAEAANNLRDYDDDWNRRHADVR